MKELKIISNGANYSAVTVGKMSDLHEHVLRLGADVTMKGKVFAGAALGTTGAEISFQYLAPGEGSAFIHTHKTHEELYIIVSGKGEYQVDGKVFPISEGAIVRVAPAGERALRNNGSTGMVMICVQYRANSFGKEDDMSVDGNILQKPVEW